MENIEIAAALDEVGDLLEIQGANPFRVRAYRNAVRTVRGLTRSLASMVGAEEDLTELPGIGKDLSAAIVELIGTGRLRRVEELGEQIPRSLVELVKLDGVGPKKARKLWQSLDVTTVDELDDALNAGRVSDLEGFGLASVERIVRSIYDYRLRAGRFLLSRVDQLVGPLVDHMKEAERVQRIELAGSHRRRKETIVSVNLLAQSELPAPDVMEHFFAFGSVERVTLAGERRGAVVLRSGIGVDLRIIPPHSFGAAMHHFTGSMEHTARVRELGLRQGLWVNERGVFRVSEDIDPGAEGEEEGERVGGDTEESVFEAVGLPWIPPVIRENRGEIEAAREGSLPELVTLNDIRGDLHMHSTWSDGKDSIEAMARACEARGYDYVAISDHSPALAMVRGLTPDTAPEQWAEIDRVQEALDEIVVLKSLEVDILRDGSLDMTDDVLEALDLVIVSVHSLMDLDQAAMTNRVIRAMQHPCVDLVGHPTGRLLGRREPFELDMEAVLQAASELGVALEINSNPKRLDLNDVHARRAKELGVKVVVSTDAHSLRQLDHISYGVDQARRAWLEKEDVLNTMTLHQFRFWVGRRKTSRT